MTEPVQAVGVLLFREHPQREFLVMRHPTRWDLPKGHLEPGETLVEAALREMEEETGIRAEQIRLVPDFHYETTYVVTYPDSPPFLKKLTIFLAWTVAPLPALTLTEHEGFQWFAWSPPHYFENPTLDPLLAQVAVYWESL